MMEKSSENPAVADLRPASEATLRPDLAISPLDPERLRLAKISYVARRVPAEAMTTLIGCNLVPQPGDLVLARVERSKGHLDMEFPGERCVSLRTGDEVVLCYGKSLATEEPEVILPTILSARHIVATEGIAGRLPILSPEVRSATEISPLGLIGDQRGHAINLRDWATIENFSS